MDSGMCYNATRKKFTSISKTSVASIFWASILMMEAAGYSETPVPIHQHLILYSPNVTVPKLLQYSFFTTASQAVYHAIKQ
jgi:hypothetical protein